MTDKSNNEVDPDATVARPAVKSDRPARLVSPPSNQATAATAQPSVRPAGSSDKLAAGSAPTPQRDGSKPTEPVRKEPSTKAKARAAAAAAGPKGDGATPAGPAAAGPRAMAGTTGAAGGANPAVGLSASNAPGATKQPATAPATDATSGSSGLTASQLLDKKDDQTNTQVIPATGDPAKESTTDMLKRKVRNPDSHRTRKARLRLAKVDPWSVMKTTFLFSIAFMIAGVAAVLLLYGVISTSGVFDSINEIVGQVLSAPGDTTPFLIQDYLTAQRVAGFTIVIGVLNVVLLTAIGTLGAFLYNLASALLGGLEVTLAED